MKNILYIHSAAEMYGADVVLLNLVKSLDRSEFEPYVILPCEGELVNKLKKNNIHVEIIDYPILRRQYLNLKGIITYIIKYFKYSNKLVKKVKEYNIDIVHVNTIAVLEGIFIKKKTNVKLIWHIHEILQKPKILADFLAKIVGRYADKTIAVSDSVKENLEHRAKFKNPIIVQYNGVDNDVFNEQNDIKYLQEEFKIPQNAIIVGMIGRINSWKGQNDLLEASKNLLEKYKNLYVIFIGGVFNGQEWRKIELEEKINNQKNRSRIIIQDFRSDVHNIHNLINIFVLPSTNPDPLPTVVLESMATGKPIVAYKHGGVCEMVKEKYNGYFAKPCDVEDLENKIEMMIKSDYKLMGLNSYKRQKELFSLESYVKNFEKIYKN